MKSTSEYNLDKEVSIKRKNLLMLKIGTILCSRVAIHLAKTRVFDGRVSWEGFSMAPCLCSTQPFLRCIAIDLDLFVIVQMLLFVFFVP